MTRRGSTTEPANLPWVRCSTRQGYSGPALGFWNGTLILPLIQVTRWTDEQSGGDQIPYIQHLKKRQQRTLCQEHHMNNLYDFAAVSVHFAWQRNRPSGGIKSTRNPALPF